MKHKILVTGGTGLIGKYLQKEIPNAVLKLINSDYEGIINLGTGKMSSLKEICKIISKLSGKSIISETKMYLAQWNLLPT